MSNQITSTKIASLFEKDIRNAIDKELGVLNEDKASTSKNNNLICCPNRNKIKNSNKGYYDKEVWC